MLNKRGIFISFEGVEGVGKTTAVQFVRDILAEHGIPYVTTREPGGTEIAESIREILLKHHQEPMSKDTELLLMFAGRAQNIERVILPALGEGKWVLSDRFTDASFAYQGSGRGVDDAHIAELARWVQRGLKPDVTLLLDAPVDLAFHRVKSRGAKDRIEAEGQTFFERVRAGYLELARQEPERFRIIDATKDLPEVQAQILKVIEPLLPT